MVEPGGMFVVGVDGCREGWIAVALQDGAFAGAGLFKSFAEIFRSCEGAEVIGVDMPVGLVESGERLCDRMVREYVGDRRSSVFIVPPRAALAQPSYDEANAECRRRTGFGMSKQMWSLRDKILEVDVVARATRPSEIPPSSGDDKDAPRIMPAGAGHKGQFVQHARAAAKKEGAAALRRFAFIIQPKAQKNTAPPPAFPGGRIIEVHPEASFRELSGAPLEASKKTYNGLMLRMLLLEKAGIRIPHQLEIGRVNVDDVLDAAAAAWSAHRYANRTAHSIPGPERWQKDGDRVVAIWI
jgi:predicted RNase H-like nuclease